MLAKGANVKIQSNNSSRALFLAVKKNRSNIVGLFIKNGADLNNITFMGFSPLHMATNLNNLSMIEYLISKGANPNIKDKKNGETPLFAATSGGKIDAVKTLIANGADRKIENNFKLTPMDVAKVNGHQEIVNIFKRKWWEIWK